MEKRIYLDNAATTEISANVYKKMISSFQQTFGNAKSIHSFGRDALTELENARETVAKCIGAKPNEIYFTSGGTESNNIAIKGFARANKNKGNHIVISAIEHDSIINTCKDLEKEGFVVSFVPVDRNGIIRYVELLKAVRPKTILVSIQMVNNEVGTIQPLQAISEFCATKEIVFHTDAVQAIGACPVDVEKNKISMLSMSAHKIHGPKGIGVLYVKSGLKIDPIVSGGGQERGLRSGTECVPLAVAMAEAVKDATENIEKNNQTLKNIKRYFLRKIKQTIPAVELNGHTRDRIPANVNLAFEGIDAKALVMLLDMSGIAVSTGSACNAGSINPSHVLMAMYDDEDRARASVRFSFGLGITPGEVDYVVDCLAKHVKKLRKISPYKIKKDKEDK